MGATAAYYRYGDKTDITEKSLRGTNEALDGLRAYLGRALAQAVAPTIQRIIASATPPDAAPLELQGEAFQNDVSSFVTAEVEEFINYRNLVHARKRWIHWSRRISWGILAMMIFEACFAAYFDIIAKIFRFRLSTWGLMGTFVVSALTAAFCFLCAGAMLRYHDQISEYRDKIL